MKLVWVVVAVSLLVVPVGAAWAQSTPGANAASAKPYTPKFEIVNEKALSPAQLADALYAKALIMNDVRPLKEAAKLDPSDPVYAYAVAVWTPRGSDRTAPEYLETVALNPEKFTSDKTSDQLQKDRAALQERRQWLAASIAADPNYLPALYLYAVTKPTHEQRLRALEHIASLDKDNAKPYYIMALIQFDKVVRGKKVIEESKMGAYPVTQAEWMSVLNYLKIGNARKVFQATPCRAPSVSNLKVYTDGQAPNQSGQAWPSDSVKNYLQFMVDDVMPGGFSGAPSSFALPPFVTQIARQTMWQARELKKANKVQEALDMLQIIQDFGSKYVVAQPYRVRTLNCGATIKSIAYTSESETLEGSKDKKALERAAQMQLTWQILTQDPVPDNLWVQDKAVKISATDNLQYPDLKAEVEYVASQLKKPGLGK